MKTVNRYRTSASFCILAEDVANIKLISEQVGKLDPENYAAVAKHGLRLGELALELEAATSDERREAIRKNLLLQNANLADDAYLGLKDGEDFLKGLLRGAHALLVGVLSANPTLAPIAALLAKIKV